MEIEELANNFAALAQPSRLEVLRMILSAGSTGCAAGSISEALNIPGPTLSFHLRTLTQSGLIICHKEGRSRIYAPDYGGIRALIDFLLTDCCQGDPRLCGPFVIHRPAPETSS